YIPGVGIDLYNIVETNVDRNEKLKEFGITDETVLLSVGELNDNKNHETIIKALSKIDKPYKYIICGRGYKEQYLKDLAEKLGIKDKVIFAGFRKDVKELMPCVDIFCFPSYREGLSLSLMEAMASGLPIVASKIRGNVDLVDDNKGGFLYAPADSEGFYKGIVRLMEIPDIMKGFGEYNLDKIQNFTKEIVADKMSEYYFFDEKEYGFLYEKQGTQFNA
ncbi:MAG: glycosyltransferase, partial [Clostridia bacterium]|nr:glycosyltransferase [Clostridia bacterium]